jgi:type IV secretion system protein VirD4
MPPSASAARSLSANRGPLAAPFAARCLAILGLPVVGLYLAGYLFLWSLSLPPWHATPLTIVRYAHYYGDRDEVRRRLVVCSAVAGSAVAVACIAVLRPRARPLHGAARFASRREVAAAGLLGNTGIILGELGSRYLMLDGQQGVALAAPPRSGKGVGVVIPNLLNWPGSVIVTDIKKENWTVTAGYRRAQGHEVHLWDPLAPDGRTARTNMFTYVPSTPDGRIDGVQKIADRLYPETPGIDPFWIASARSLFVGISLYLFETPSLPKTIGEVRRQGMASDDEGFARHWRRIVEGRSTGRFPLSAECVRALFDVIDLAPVTASSIRKTFTSRLDLWANPMLDRATSGDDFDLRDLRKRPMSIYVGVNPDDLHRLRPLLALFFQQAIGLQTLQLPEHNPDLKYQVLMLLDEFAALGRIPIIAEAVAFLPGYNVRVVPVFQSFSQLRDVYGPNAAQTIVKALAARIVFAPKDGEDAKDLSEELGYVTVKARSLSRPRFAQWGGKGASRGGNITVSEQRRALLLPQECKEIGADHAIVFYEGLRPIFAKKVRYFDDPRFRSRLLPPPEQPVVPGSGSVSGLLENPASAAAAPDSAGAAAELRPREPPEEASAWRAPDASDVERLDSLTLADFGTNLDHIQLPQDRAPNEGELQAAVDQFLAALRPA